jgi:two-component system, cell cycle response regulator
LRKILSVDDDPKILSAFQAALRQKGYEVFITSNPNEVAQILKNHDIDLIMLDIKMPEKSGFDIFRELKKKYQSLPVLFITAYPKSFSMRSDEMVKMWQEDFADGNTDIMYKPFNVEALYEKVEGLIGASDAESKP